MPFNDFFQQPNEAQTAAAFKSKEEEGRFKNYLILLEKWMDSQSHLPKNYEKNLLDVYLRCAKHDINKAKEKLEMFFICKEKLPEILSVKEFTHEEWPVVKNTISICMPKLTPDGARICIVGLRDSNIDLFDFNIILRYVFTTVQLRCCSGIQLGDIHIFDMANLKASHLTKIQFSVLKRLNTFVKNAFFVRTISVHFINSAPFCEPLINTVKHFFKPKLRDRVSVDQGSTSLLKYMPKNCLPLDYGGTQLSINELADMVLEFMEEKKEWFEYWESVRLAGPIPKKILVTHFDDHFGAEGSFRKLNVD